MRNNGTKKISILLYIVAVIMTNLPWFLIENRYCTLYQVYVLAKESDASQDWCTSLNVIKIQLIVILLYQLIGICYIFILWLKKNCNLNIIALVLSGIYLFMFQDGTGFISGNMLGAAFPCIPAVIGVFEFLFKTIMATWKDAVKISEESAEKDRIRKEEEKRRLSFPGNYTELFFQIIWRNFKYDWRDYSLLLMCSTVVASLTFAGIGCYQMIAGIHREENFLIGQGLGRIVWNAMIPLSACAVFLMVFMMIFYLQKWMESYSVFMMLGIRKKALHIILALEIMIGFMISVVSGVLIGNGVLFALRKVFYYKLGEGVNLTKITAITYLEMLGVMVFIYVVSLLMTQSIVSDFNLITAATRRIRRERMPKKRLELKAATGCIFLIVSVILYRQLTRHESIYLLCVFFLGVFLVLRYGGAVYLTWEQSKEYYVKKLLKRNHLHHKSKSAAWYLTALVVLNICAIFYFSFQSVSVSIAEEPESLFPYDFVCIADESDNEFFCELESDYGVDIMRYPMVRVSNADKTEKLEGMGEKVPQGQQIGISETTFHQLKKALEEDYQEEDLNLDDEGNKVYIVHQQDRSVKAQPVDWTYGSRKPFLHIGLPCIYYVTESASKAFTKREIAGEEIGSLIGCFRQGNLENMIVFSDTYFREAQDMWKYTNIYTGDMIADEEERIEDVTIRQGPTKLVLIKADQDDIDAIEQEMEKFKQNHAYEESYDSEVNCYYSKRMAVEDMKTEHVMKQIINLFVVIVLMMTSMFLLYIKTLSELEGKKSRAYFLKCIGMRKKGRVRILKGELYLFYWIPALTTVIATFCFTAAAFYARMYTGEVRKAYLINALYIWVGWILIEGVFVLILGKWLVWKVEGEYE